MEIGMRIETQIENGTGMEIKTEMEIGKDRNRNRSKNETGKKTNFFILHRRVFWV